MMWTHLLRGGMAVRHGVHGVTSIIAGFSMSKAERLAEKMKAWL